MLQEGGHENYTNPTQASVAAFLSAIPDEARRNDCRTVLKIMKEAAKAEPVMWGTSIVGFGRYHYKYGSGREGDWFLTGFSPRKRELSLYFMGGFARYDTLLRKLGRYKTGKSCLSIQRLADIDLVVLKQLVRQSVRHIAQGQ